MPKKGDGRAWLFIIVGVTFGGLIAMLVFFLLVSSTSTSRAVLEENDHYDIYSSTVVRGLFSIVSVRFADSENASCTKADDYLRPAIMTLQFQTYEVPETCSIFVNDRLYRTERRLEPDCRVACEGQQFNRQFSIGDFDYRDDHIIKVCCQQICLEKRLEGLCSAPTKH
jgi:hypothetical protein